MQEAANVAEVIVVVELVTVGDCPSATLKLSGDVSATSDALLQLEGGIPKATCNSFADDRQNVTLGYVSAPSVNVQPESIALVPPERICCRFLTPSSREAPTVVVVPKMIREPSAVMAKAYA